MPNAASTNRTRATNSSGCRDWYNYPRNLTMSQQPSWTFFPQRAGETERDPVSGEFFSNDTRLEAIVRESIQNSLDARVNKDGAVAVRIFFSGMQEALPAECYAKYRTGADERYSDSGSGLLQPIPGNDEPCPYLVIEDFETTGLTGITTMKPLTDPIGDGVRDWNYFNYFFRENLSNKAGSGSLGSWGAGKCVFQRASRLKSSFALSIRDGYEPRRFLAGKATLQIHRDKDLVTWSPDGWFGVMIEEDEDTNKILKQPVTDEIFINQFSKDFKLTRVDQPGTSIVIPYVFLSGGGDGGLGDYNKKNLVRAVLRNFLVAILDGKLNVMIQVGQDGEIIEVSREKLHELVSFLPLVTDRDALVTQEHYRMIAEAESSDFPEDRRFAVSEPDKPTWENDLLPVGIVKKAREVLKKRKCAVFDVSMPILKKSGNGVETLHGSFRVAIEKCDLKRALPPVFFRIGLLVDSVNTDRMNGHIAAVIIREGEVASMLVASEPPSHNEWKRDADRIKAQYETPWNHILYVSYVVRNILEAIAASDKEPNKEVLGNVFGLPKKAADDPDRGRKSKDDNDDDGEGDDDDDKDKNRHEKIVEVHGVSGGFCLKNGPGYLTAKAFPFQAVFKIGYDTFNGLSWGPNDFSLEKNDRIQIGVETGGERVKVSGKGNVLTLQIEKPGTTQDTQAFLVRVTGFDENRDVIVAGPRYKYQEEA